LLDEITHLPKLATDYALDYRYRKEAAVSRELSEKADRLAERVQRRSSGDRNAQQDDTPLIVAHVSHDSESYRLLLSDGTPPLRAGREVLRQHRRGGIRRRIDSRVLGGERRV
jgi:hypothetical protein